MKKNQFQNPPGKLLNIMRCIKGENQKMKVIVEGIEYEIEEADYRTLIGETKK